jgi:hypothetical protein
VHHHWLLVKFCCIPGAWPYVNIMIRGQPLTAPLFPGAAITNADWLSVLYLAILSSFAWEICYRCKISPVSLLHHAGAIVLGAWQIAGDESWVPYTSVVPPDGQFIDTRENDQQFKIILTYGIFEGEWGMARGSSETLKRSKSEEIRGQRERVEIGAREEAEA